MSGLTGDWDALLGVLSSAAKEARSAVDKSVRDEAMLFKAAVVMGMTKGGSPRFKQLSSLTTLLRRKAGEITQGSTTQRGSKPLIASGTMRRSVNARRVGYAKYEVGVDRRSRKGANIAAIHEKGAVIDVDANNGAVRRWFFFLFLRGIINKPLSPNTRTIIIPARPFFTPVLKRFARGYGARMEKRIMHYMEGGKRLPFSEFRGTGGRVM